MAELMDSHDLDLPLLSNTEEITVYHYVLDLECHFEQKQFIGNITIFCKSVDTSSDTRGTDCGDRTCSSDNPGPDSLACSCKQATISSENNAYLERHFKSNNTTEHAKHDIICEKCHVTQATKDTSAAECDISPDAISAVTKCVRRSEICMGSSIGTEQDKHVSVGETDIQRRKLQLSKDPRKHKQFEMVLDSWDIDVESVEEINDIDTDFLEGELTSGDSKFRKYTEYSKMCGKQLEFVSEKNSIKVCKSIDFSKDIPNAIKIRYKTDPKGHSLKWTKDQDGRLCVFTHGHWVNNRSLFPSQDVPVAMATWQACIHAPIGAVVLMSGDENPTISHENEEYSAHSYHTHMAMPSSTLSLAVGYWTEVEIVPRPSDDLDISTVLPCRLFTPRVHQKLATNVLGEYMPKCMTEAANLLGCHPFKRLDVLVVTASFASLGMASPSLMFISQSVLTNGMSIRLAHELSHSWFGLLIGPRDWTEEWLSEGFCTYLEACVHGRVMGWSEEYRTDEAQIQDLLAYRTLVSELESTNQGTLQTLRPNKGETGSGVNESKYVINGMNPDKLFMQVHYIKGYFLLKYLANLVGRSEFHEFLKCFVRRYAGKLILSQDFVSMVFESLTCLTEMGLTEDAIYKQWLDCPELPKALTDMQVTSDTNTHAQQVYTLAVTDMQVTSDTNTHAQQVYTLVREIYSFIKTYHRLHWRKRQKLDPVSSVNFPKLDDIQLLLFLDELIRLEKIHIDLLDAINTTYDLDTTKRKACSFGVHNADIQHKWCELIIKNRHCKLYGCVRYFLINHQAMGVYLFGELIVSRDKAQRHLAELCFREISADMEEGVYKTVHMMIYGC